VKGGNVVTHTRPRNRKRMKPLNGTKNWTRPSPVGGMAREYTRNEMKVRKTESPRGETFSRARRETKKPKDQGGGNATVTAFPNQKRWLRQTQLSEVDRGGTFTRNSGEKGGQGRKKVTTKKPTRHRWNSIGIAEWGTGGERVNAGMKEKRQDFILGRTVGKRRGVEKNPSQFNVKKWKRGRREGKIEKGSARK